MLRKDQTPAENICYAREYPVLSRVLIVLDKVFWDFNRNHYQKISLPFYTVHASDYEKIKIYQAIRNYHLDGEARINYGVLNLWMVKKNGSSGSARLSIVDFDAYISMDQFISRWPENVHEIIENLNDLGRYYSFSLTSVKFYLYRLVLGGCYGDCDGRAVVPLQQQPRLTSDDV